MKLCSNYLHARPVKVDRIGSIALPQSVTRIQSYSLWDVVGVGPGRRTSSGVRVPMECRAGDRIVTTFEHSGAMELPDGTAILSEDQVLLVISRP